MAKKKQETQETLETKVTQETVETKETDISLKEIERIGLGKRNMTNESIRAAKRKKRKKKFLGITGAILMISLAGGTYWYTQIRETKSEVESSEDIQVGDGQELVLGQITKINGNEMTFVLVEETEVTNERGSMNQSKDAATSGNEMPTGEVPTGEMPTGEMPTGEMPTDMQASTETTDTTDTNQSNVENAENAQAIAESTVTYTALEEERTMTIPVGTQVVTKLGTVTTFSRLASSDVMKILTENSGDEDVIIKIWIVG